MEIIILYGPPGAGKTAYAIHNCRYGDLVIDQDRLYEGLTGLNSREKPAHLYELIEKIRFAIIEICEKESLKYTCWVVLSSLSLRNYFLQKYKKAKIIEFNVSRSECYRNISKDKTRNFENWKIIVDKWFNSNC